MGLNVGFADSALISTVMVSFSSRNGVVRYESVMKLQNKLEELGKIKGVNQDEKGFKNSLIY